MTDTEHDTEHDTGTRISDRLARARAERDALNAQADAAGLPQAKRTSRPLTPDERANGRKPEPGTIQLSRAQLRRLTTLEAQMQNAQNALNGFVSYICDEHGIEDISQWKVMQDGRLVRKQADASSGESDSPGSG